MGSLLFITLHTVHIRWGVCCSLLFILFMLDDQSVVHHFTLLFKMDILLFITVHTFYFKWTFCCSLLFTLIWMKVNMDFSFCIIFPISFSSLKKIPGESYSIFLYNMSLVCILHTLCTVPLTFLRIPSVFLLFTVDLACSLPFLLCRLFQLKMDILFPGIVIHALLFLYSSSILVWSLFWWHSLLPFYPSQGRTKSGRGAGSKIR